MQSDLSQQFSRMTGAAVFSILMLALAFHLLKKRKLPDVNGKALWSLALTVLTFAIASPAQIITKGIPIASVAIGFISLIAFVSAIILAVQGLLEIRRAPESARGRAYAWWTLGIMGLFIIPTAVAGFNKARSNAKIVALPHSLPPGESISFENLNFRFTVPEAKWVQMDAKRLNKDASLAFMRGKPQIFCFVIAEQLPDTPLDSEGLVEIAQGQIRASLENGEVTKARQHTANGVEGLIFEESGRSAGQAIFGVHWCAATNGFLYQVLVRGFGSSTEEVRDYAPGMVAQFHMIDPKREASGNTLKVHHSLQFHYSIDLAGTKWKEWPAASSELTGADFGASQGNDCYLGVIPVYLHNLDAPMELMAQALANRIGLEFPHSDVSNVDQSDGEISFSHKKTVKASNYDFRCRIVKTNGFAYWMVGWWDSERNRRKDVDMAFGHLVVHERATTAKLDPGQDGFGITPAGLPPESRASQAEILDSIGLAAFAQKETEKALEWFRLAQTYNPTNVVILKNALYCFRLLGNATEALQSIERSSTPGSRDPAIEAYHAYFLGQNGETEAAIRIYERLFEGSYANEAQFNDYVDLLSANDKVENALARLEKYLTKHESKDLRILQSQLLARTGKKDEAIDVLLAARKKSLYAAELELALASAQIGAGKQTDAVKTLDELIRRGNSGAYVQMLKGEGQLGLKLYREARASFENAAKSDPKNKEIQSYLDYVNALLGQGQNYSIREKIEPVAFSKELLGSTNYTNTEEDRREFGAYYEYDVIAVEFKKGISKKETRHFRAHLLDQSGVSRFSVIQVPFDPISETVYVNELQVLDNDGKQIAQGDPDQYYVIDAPTGMASYDKLINIPVPSLKPGVTIQGSITTRQVGAPKHFPFCAFELSRQLPTASFMLLLSGDIGEISRSLPARFKFTPTNGYEVLRIDKPSVTKWEPLQPEDAENLAYLGPTSRDWNIVAAEYLAEIADKLGPDAKVRSLAQETTKDLKNETAIVNSLCSAVQRIRYKALEFGTRGRVPNHSSKTLAQGFGDCKDSAVLLQALLQSRGIESKLALVRPGRKIVRDMPSLDQFTHVIVYLPSTGTFVDATDKGLHIVNQLPVTLFDTEAFVLDSTRPQFLSIKAPDKPENRVVTEREVRTTPEGTVEIDEVTTFYGYAAGIRSSFTELPQLDRKALVQRFVAHNAAGLELLEWTETNLDKTGEPLRFNAKYRLKKRLPGSGTVQLHFPYVWDKLFLAAERSAKRRMPFKIYLPADLVSKTLFRYPEAWKVSGNLEARAAKEKWISTQLTPAPQTQKSELHYEARTSVVAGTYPAEEYNGYCQALEEVTRLLEPELTFQIGNNEAAGQKQPPL